MPRLLVALILALVLAVPASATPRPDLWAPFDRHDPAGDSVIDHTPWARILDRHVHQGEDGINRVSYGSFTDGERRALDLYVGSLEDIPISRYSRKQQLAYWINLFNAATLQLVLQRYPVDSVLDIDLSPGDPTDGPWSAKLLFIEGERVSLDDIVHRILRPIWRDARVHYALSFACLGCPNLQREPFRADGIEKQLDAAALQFINSGRAVWIDADRLRVSSLYTWYAEDFGGSPAEIIRHLMAYAEPELAKRLQSFREIAGEAIDWRLNDVRP